MRNWIGTIVRSAAGRVAAAVVLATATVGAVVAFASGDDDPVTAGAVTPRPHEPGTVADTAEEAMEMALWGWGGRTPQPAPGEECRKVTVGEIVAAWRAAPPEQHATVPGFVDGAPEDLVVWACPVVFPPNGRGVGYVAAEPTDIDIGGGSARFNLGKVTEPSSSTTTTAGTPNLNELQTPTTIDV